MNANVGFGAGTGTLAAYGADLLSRARTISTDRLHRRVLSLPGLTVEAWFTDPAYAELCARNIRQKTHAVSKPDLTVFLLDAETLGWPAPERWGADVFDRHAMNGALESAGLRGAYLHDPRVWQFFSPERQLGVQLIRRPGALPPWEQGAPLRAFLHWGLKARGIHLCHAATLGREGRGLLLVGAGGSGKSGTTLAGIAGGLETVGDDYCLLTAGERIAALPLYRILKQDPEGVARVLGDGGAKTFGPVNWQGKFEIHESALQHSPFVETLDIRAIVIPEVAHAERSIFQPVSAALAMRAFAPSSSFQLPDGEKESIAFAAALCRRLPCFKLSLSTDSADIARTIGSFLERDCQ